MKSDLKLKIAKEINKLKAKKGLTNADIAKLLDIPDGTIGGWTCGYTVPSNKNLFKLKEKLGLDLVNIIYGEDD